MADISRLDAPMRVLSLGAGVQSSALYLMMTKGEIEPASVAIFADTGDEPAKVYAWLDWLEKQSHIPIHRVSAGNLSEATFRVRISKKNGKPYLKNFVPSFSFDPVTREAGMMPRKCTTDFKIVPIMRELRRLAKPKRGEKNIIAESVIGISWDEAHRMKSAWYPWARNVYPLVDRQLTRWHCLDWMARNGYPEPPRSACVYCPFHSDKEWLRLKHDEPAEFDKAVQFERRLWETAAARGVKTREFLHADRVPLDKVNLRDDRAQVDMFGNECDGLCGV